MYLSRLCPNVRSAAVRRDLADPYQMHRTLLRAFPDRDAGGSGRVLFRVDQPRAGSPAVLVLSDREPTWDELPGQYADDAVTTSYDGVTFRASQRLHFRLRANPSKRVHKADDPRWIGKRVGLVGEKDQLAWLVRKAAVGGFKILDVSAIPEGTVCGHKADHKLKLATVLFDGILEVTDPVAFRNALFAGIGPGKALGFGLLSVAPA